MNALTFNIQLLEPLLVTQLGSGDENSAESLNYIPGSVLRNALAARYIAARTLKDAANDETCRKLFFDERVFVLNSYRADRLGGRSLPIPLSWYAKKDELAKWTEGGEGTLTLYDGAVDDAIFGQESELKPFAKRSDFCSLPKSDDDERVVEPVPISHQINVHIQREHKRQLKTKGETNVFAYQALAAGEIFCGAILAEDADALNQFAQLLQETPEFRIGGSRSAGYGLIRISNVSRERNWHEATRGESDDGKIIVTLLSDVIGRDENGQFMDAIDARIGAREKGKSFRQMKQVGGFNRKWGLPLPQAHAIQAGSVFVFPRESLDENLLQRALERGIGERRQDGFGRIAVNWNTASEFKAQRLPLEESHRSQISLVGDAVSENLTRKIIEHQVRKELDAALQHAILDDALKFHVASKSAFARVRLAARQSIFKGKLEPLQDLLQNIEGKHAAKKLQESRGAGTNLYEWLQARVRERDVEKQLNPDLNKISAVGGMRVELTQELKTEYTARLIEGVVRRAQNKEASSD
ncbi:MAG TPA: RAMP superfamily CRISPR-associated protein [Anaerolineae bacterium]|nr:RAMP superfamily CRISPR-associated protein [Anaerolineae bacterium]